MFENSKNRTTIELLNRILQITKEISSKNPDYKAKDPRTGSGNDKSSKFRKFNS